MPPVRALGPLFPYFRPYRWRLALGLASVVASAALAGVVPWLLRAAIDGLRADTPVSHARAMAAAVVAVSLAAGAIRYLMRELLNGVSRRIEYDLRNSL